MQGSFHQILQFLKTRTVPRPAEPDEWDMPRITPAPALSAGPDGKNPAVKIESDAKSALALIPRRNQDQSPHHDDGGGGQSAFLFFDLFTST
jgi:hypothetical protein